MSGISNANTVLYDDDDLALGSDKSHVMIGDAVFVAGLENLAH